VDSIVFNYKYLLFRPLLSLSIEPITLHLTKAATLLEWLNNRNAFIDLRNFSLLAEPEVFPEVIDK